MDFDRSNAAEMVLSALMSSMLGLYSSRRYKYVMLNTSGSVATYATDDAFAARPSVSKALVFKRDESDNIIITSASGHKLDKDYNTAQDKFQKFCMSLSSVANPVLHMWSSKFYADFHTFMRGGSSLASLEKEGRLTSRASGYSRAPYPSLAVVTATFVPGETPMVEYYADIVDAFLERKSTERVGKWFGNMGIGIDTVYIGFIVGSMKPTTVFFTKNGDEVTDLYVKRCKDGSGVSACMSKSKGELYGQPTELSDHPTSMYSRDISIAYITDDNQPTGKVLARAICVPSKKIFARSYGDTVRIENALTMSGFKAGGEFRDIDAGMAISRAGGYPFGFRTPYFDIARRYMRPFRDKDGSWGLRLTAGSSDSVPVVEGRVYADLAVAMENQLTYVIVFGEDGKFSVCKFNDLTASRHHALVRADGMAYVHAGKPKYEHLAGALPVRVFGRATAINIPTYLLPEALEKNAITGKWAMEAHEGRLYQANEDHCRTTPISDFRSYATRSAGIDASVPAGYARFSTKCERFPDGISLTMPKSELVYGVDKDGKFVAIDTIYGKTGLTMYNGMNFTDSSHINVFVREEFVTVMKRLLGSRVKLPEKVSDVIANLDPVIGMNIAAEMPALNGKAIGERVAAVLAAVPEMRTSLGTMLADYAKTDKAVAK